MQAAYMQSPHFCDIYNAIMFNKYPKQKRAIEKLHQAMLSQYVIQGGLLYIYMKNNFGEKEPVLCVPHPRLTYFGPVSHFVAGRTLRNYQMLPDTLAKNIMSQSTLLC